jgi:hypothetical protein
MKNRTTAIVAVGAAIALMTTASSCGSNHNAQQSANARDNAQQGQTMDRLSVNQPPPSPDTSQMRQTIIDIENAEIHGTATTSFGPAKSLSDATPRWSCPSIGFPVPADAQLSNPHQVQYTGHPNGGSDANVVEQADPNGVYIGPTTGTFVVCVSPNGLKYYVYEEDHVNTVGGPAHWDNGIVLDGAPSIPVTEKH